MTHILEDLTRPKVVPVKPAKRRSSKNHSLDPLIFRGLKCFSSKGRSWPQNSILFETSQDSFGKNTETTWNWSCQIMTDTWKIPNIWVWYTCLSSGRWKFPSSHLCYPAVFPWSDKGTTFTNCSAKKNTQQTLHGWCWSPQPWGDNLTLQLQWKNKSGNTALTRPYFWGWWWSTIP